MFLLDSSLDSSIGLFFDIGQNQTWNFLLSDKTFIETSELEI